MNLLYDNLDKIINITLMMMISLYLRILLQALGQTWNFQGMVLATIDLLEIA